MHIKHLFKLCDLSLFATDILWYKRNLTQFDFTYIFFLTILLFLFYATP